MCWSNIITTLSCQIEIKEEDRLAAVVARIDADVGVVPLGAYLRTALNSIIINKSFHGELLCEHTPLFTGMYNNWNKYTGLYI